MRMGNFLFGGLFWGILLVLFGVSLIFKTIFHIDLHLGRIFFAAVVILFGISMLTGRHTFGRHISRNGDEYTSVFNDGPGTSGEIERQYNILFGREIIDLRDWDPEKDPLNVEVNTIFASAELLLPGDAVATVKGTTVFGSTRFPDGDTAAFGDRTYRQQGNRTGQSLYVETNTVFGSLLVLKR